MFNYQSKVKRIVDGDTIEFRADLGFYTHHIFTARLRRVDTAETHGVSHDSEEYDKGVEQTEFVRGWVQHGRKTADDDDEWPFVISTGKDQGSFSRWLAEVYRKSDYEDADDLDQAKSLNARIIAAYPEAVYED